MVLALSKDRFAIDDSLPLVRPVSRTVKVAMTLSGPAADLMNRMARAADEVEVVADATAADLLIGRIDAAAEIDGIQLAGTDESASESPGESQNASAGKPVAYDPAWVAAEDHSLTRDLGWGGLMSGSAGNLPLTVADEPLLWKGGKPFAFERSTVLPGGRSVQNLILNFDVAGSTAARSPAVVVLVQRFIDRVRTRINRPWAENFETGQVIEIPPRVAQAPAGGAMMSVTGVDGAPLVSKAPFRGRAPWLPAFFTVAAGRESPANAPLVRGSAQFADSRESDFRKASLVDTLEAIRMEQAMKQSIARRSKAIIE
jgi:hypothetical protein